MDWRNATLCLLVAVILTCLLVIGMGQAYERVDQGDTVYVNETIDISGAVGWSSELVWAGRWASSLSVDNESILYELELPDYKSEYYKFYLDPAIFKDRLGWWYQYYGTYEKGGNLRAFYVRDHRPIIVENNTIATNITIEPTPTKLPIEEKIVSDYVVARGDPFAFKYQTEETVSVWMFGRIDAVYDSRFNNGAVYFPSDAIKNMESGDYTLWVLLPGKNGQLDCRYTKGQIEYFSINDFTVGTIPADKLSPQVTLQKLREALKQTDDQIVEYKLAIGDPYIEITVIDPQYLADDTLLMKIKGYTNEIAGKTFTFTIDPELVTPVNAKLYTFTAQSQATANPGALRYFDASVPIFWSNISSGQHEIQGTTPLKAQCNVDFYIYNMPEGQVRPTQTIRYVGGNEFKATPTPEKVTVIQTEIVHEIQQVPVPVTPSDEQVRKQQESVFWSGLLKITTILFIGGGSFAAAVYLRSIVLRVRNERGIKK